LRKVCGNSHFFTLFGHHPTRFGDKAGDCLAV
jgi:hypothetical protein